MLRGEEFREKMYYRRRNKRGKRATQKNTKEVKENDLAERRRGTTASREVDVEWK